MGGHAESQNVCRENNLWPSTILWHTWHLKAEPHHTPLRSLPWVFPFSSVEGGCKSLQQKAVEICCGKTLMGLIWGRGCWDSLELKGMVSAATLDVNLGMYVNCHYIQRQRMCLIDKSWQCFRKSSFRTMDYCSCILYMSFCSLSGKKSCLS